MDDPIDKLADVIGRILYPFSSPTQSGLQFGGDAPGNRQLSEQDKLILRALIQEAVGNGLLLDDVSKNELVFDRPNSGSTARAVVFARQPIRFAVKLQDTKKVVEEARLLRACQNRHDLPLRLRQALPKVYAIKDVDPPYAYILEHFASHRGLDRLLFEDQVDRPTAQRLMAAALDVLFEAYAATADRSSFPLLPDLNRLYVVRIEDRIKAAAELSSEFASLINRPLMLNGLPVPAFSELLGWIKQQGPRLRDLSPPFATFVHGDVHPENILVRFDVHSVDVKLIDPKEWGDGDYLFDISKMTHYLEVTGPMEKSAGLSGYEINDLGSKVDIKYAIAKPSWTSVVIDDIRSRVAEFATSARSTDPSWEVRYRLAMAANLLGLPERRLERGNLESAIVMFAEGTKWLADFQLACA